MTEPKKYVCDLNLRPRVGGKPLLITAGEEFDATQVSEGTIKELMIQGHCREAPEAAEVSEEAPEVEAPAAEAEEAPEAEEATEPEKQNQTGIWDFKRSEIEGFELTELNAIYKQRADQHSLNVRPFTNKDNLLDKMCSES